MVLLIVGVLLALAVPRLPSLGGSRLEGSGRRIATLISYLYDEAALRGRIYRLTFDLDREAYDIAVLAPYASGEMSESFVESWDPYAHAAVLPDGVGFLEVESPQGRATTGTRELYFVPEGDVESVTVRLATAEGRQLEVALDGSSGRVAVMDPEALP